MESNFFERKGSHYCAVLLEYEPMISQDENMSYKPVEKREDNFKNLLKEEDWPLFKRLREWRGEVSKKEGVPPYIIFTNKQLAKIAFTRPVSLNALQQIEGVGNVKIWKEDNWHHIVFWKIGRCDGKGIRKWLRNSSCLSNGSIL